jgi:hypothetical protein
MKNSLRLAMVCAFALLISIPAFAQTPETSTLPVTEPLEVGGTVLQPGDYVIRVLRSHVDRNKVQITNPEMTKVYATLLTVPHALQPNEKMPNTMFVYYPAADGLPRALRTWYAPNPSASQGGHDIVYDATRAQQLARLTKAPVVAYEPGIAVADLDTAPLEVVTPEAETLPYVAPVAPKVAETPKPAPPTRIAESRPVEMPNTASNLPLIALIGLVSLAGAVAFRLGRQ